MTNQTLITIIIVLCSMGGWYVVISKYLELKAMLKDKPKDVADKKPSSEPLPVVEDVAQGYLSLGLGKHVPGMGPPPLSDASLQLSPELLAKMQQTQDPKETPPTSAPSQPSMNNSQQVGDSPEKRSICNWAAILHLSGFSMITGIMFINIVVPVILWLLKKEQHPYIAKQGREVINFHITLTLMQILCLSLGTMFIWLFPDAATGLFAWTRTVRIVFSTGMYVPFNLFTAAPFIWGCVVMIRGTVSAYYGLSFKYPYAQPFIMASKTEQLSQPLIKTKQSSVKKPKNNKVNPKINFG